jgi:hypothetical protein
MDLLPVFESKLAAPVDRAPQLIDGDNGEKGEWNEGSREE